MDSTKSVIGKIGLPRLIIGSFFLILCVLAAYYDMNMPNLISDVIRRWGMNAILVLAMVPGIQSGIGLNFGVTLGIASGLLGAVTAIELKVTQWEMFAANPALGQGASILIAIAISLVIAAAVGSLYGVLLNRVKGSEMTVSTYVGFSIVAFMNMMWLFLPFKNGEIIWPVGGEGARNTINLQSSFGGVFNNFLAFSIGGVTIPTGTILMLAFCCLCVWLFLRSKTGLAMTAAGANPLYARASGINVNKMRIIGTAISTTLGAVGIINYAQTYGFLQLYNAPLMMSFACVAAVLIGGASVSRANIVNVIVGTFLFQGLLTVALPVINRMLPESNLSEVLRIIVSNGIILYALTKAGGAKSE